MATFNYLPIAITYHGALSILIGASTRSAFSALRLAPSNYYTQPWALCAEIISLRRHMVSPRGRNATHWKCWCALAASAKVLETSKPLSKDTPHKIISCGACGSAAPGFREPSRETSRSVGFNPIAQQVIALLSRSPEALGPGSRQEAALC